MGWFMQNMRAQRAVLTWLLAVLAAIAVFVVAAIPAAAMTVTFVRHGQSEGNASGLIDTKVPGPPLTDTGWTEADYLVDPENPDALNTAAYDGVYASTMVRTQQTATPFAAAKYHSGDQSAVTTSTDPYHPDYGSDIVVLNGLQEISAGIFEGSPEGSGIGRIGYILAPVAWTLGLRFVRIPGSENGNEFDARVDAALAQMADPEQGDSDNPVVFSHGATIMFWTMMNVDNPDLLLLLQHPLDNTDVVVVEQNDAGGWTLVSWAGEDVDQDPSLPVKLFVNTRDLIVAPQTATYNMREPLLALDGPAIVETAAQGVSDVGAATVTFARNTVRDITQAVIPSSMQTERISTPLDGVKSEVASRLAPKSNGATNLTDGNKAEPGKVARATVGKARKTLEDIGDRVETSIEKATQKINNAVKPTDKTDKSDKESAKESAKDAA